MKRILVRCPSTSKLTSTGKTVEESAWATTNFEQPNLSCPHCGKVHVWSKTDVVLARQPGCIKHVRPRPQFRAAFAVSRFNGQM